VVKISRRHRERGSALNRGGPESLWKGEGISLKNKKKRWYGFPWEIKKARFINGAKTLPLAKKRGKLLFSTQRTRLTQGTPVINN